MDSRQASIIMIIGAILWGTNPALIKLASWTPFGTAWTRALFCAGLLLLYFLYQIKFSLKSIKLQLLSAIFLAANSILFVSASLYTTPANAVVLMFVFPWITMGLDFLIEKKIPSRGDTLRLLLGFTGIVVIVWNGLNQSGALGNTFALLAGVAIALHIFFSQRLGERHESNQEVLSSIMFAWIITIIGLTPFVLQADAPSIISLNKSQLFYLFLFGLLSAIPWLLWAKAITYIPGHVVASLLGVEVFMAALCGWLLLGELPYIETWVGGIFILIAATTQILSSVSEKKH